MRLERLKICLIGTWSAGDVLAPELVKRRYLQKKRIPTCPWLRALALELAGRGDVEQVTVLVHTREVRHARTHEQDKLRLVFVPKREPGQTDPYHLHWPARLQLRPWLRRIAPDLVHGFGTEASYGWLAARSGFPNVVKIQGIVSELRPHLGWSAMRCSAMAWLERRTVEQAGALIVTSAWARRWACRYRAAEDIQYIPNAVSPEFLEVETDYTRQRCVCIGTLTVFKNPQMVIRAFAAAKSPGAKLVMIGEGPLREACEALAVVCGVADRVLFTGRISREAVIGHLRSARCLAIGSRVDTSPNVVTEALSMGVPVVGADGGGIPDMIRHGEEGFVVLQEDSESMGRHLGRLLTDPKLARSMGRAGMRRVRAEHSSGSVGQAHVDWYRAVLERQGGRRGIR